MSIISAILEYKVPCGLPKIKIIKLDGVKKYGIDEFLIIRKIQVTNKIVNILWRFINSISTSHSFQFLFYIWERVHQKIPQYFLSGNNISSKCSIPTFSFFITKKYHELLPFLVISSL